MILQEASLMSNKCEDKEMVRTKNATFFFFWLTLSVLNPLCSESCDIFNIWRHYSSAYSPGQKVSISLKGIKVLRHTPKHASHKGNGASVSCILGMCALVKHFGYPVSSQLVSMSLCFALCAEFASLWDATSLVINWILVTPLFSPPPPRSPSRDSRFALHFTLQRDAQWSVLCLDHCVSRLVHRSYELTRLNVQILNIRQYSVLIIKYIIL